MSKAIFVLALAATAAAVCPYTCTTTNAADTTGDGCMMASGNLTAEASTSTLCNDGYYPASAYTCPEDGSNTTISVNCTNDIANIDSANYVAAASAIGRGFSLPGACSCSPGDVFNCVKTNDFSPTCTNCVLSCTLAEDNIARQNTLAAGAVCPPAVDTLAEAKDCFEQAACAGAINPKVDTCVYGNDLNCHSGECPECPSSSKKSLLGLLGLLGLIPLLLLSLLCCCLLCCIRRRKVERDVHFATFDAGAPAVAAPVCADVPVASHYQTVHHSTFVGPEHAGLPVGSHYGAPAVGAPFGATAY